MIQLNRVYLQDCIEGRNDIPDKSIDMILCDLPYGVTKNEWDVPIPQEALWSHYRRIIKDDGAIVLTAQQPFTTDLINAARDIFRYSITWVKSNPTGFLNANRTPLKCHEDIVVFYKRQPIYNPQKTKLTNVHEKRVKQNTPHSQHYNDFGPSSWKEDGLRYPIDVIFHSNHNGSLFGRKKKDSTVHPTQKPIDLCEYLIRTYTEENGVVLDNCSGLGSTAVACVRTGRQYIGFETDPTYYELSLKRIREAEQAEKVKTSLFDFAEEGKV